MSKVSHEGPAVEAIKQKMILAESSYISEFECMGRLFNIHKNVFPPTHFQSTGIFTNNIPYIQNTSFLELGCGAGVTAVTAALEGCYPVVASDISGEAVENTLFNVIRHNVNNFVSVRHGDLFDTLEEGESFDVIFGILTFYLFLKITLFRKKFITRFMIQGI
ncbi:methyltransferase [Photorhabdus sp. SF281]|uniref:methyltransferase n=1 Tax=Photorhabdus sp. SF281 TaxID=3459527 RepID=UPI0040443BB4